MAFPLLPTFRADALTDIPGNFFHQQGVRLLMLDFDNTIVPYTTDTPTPQMTAWLAQMNDSGVILCVVSNSKNDRVKRFCEKYGLHCITRAKKPFSKGIRECLRKFDCKPEEALLVGDQIYTDTLGGNLCGVRTVLVKSIHNHHFWLKLRHVAELPFIYFARNRRITK